MTGPPSDPFCDIDMACLEKFIEFAEDPKHVLTGAAAALCGYMGRRRNIESP